MSHSSLYVTRTELANELGVSPRTIDAMIRDGRLPKPIRLGAKIIRFLRQEVDSALLAARA